MLSMREKKGKTRIEFYHESVKKNYIPSNPCPLLFQRAHGSRHEFIVHVLHHGPEGQRRRKRRRRGGHVGESADDGSDDRGEDRVIVAEGVRNRSRARLDANVRELTRGWTTGRRIIEGRGSVSGGVGEEKGIHRRRRKTSTASPMTKRGARRVDEELGNRK